MVVVPICFNVIDAVLQNERVLYLAFPRDFVNAVFLKY